MKICIICREYEANNYCDKCSTYRCIICDPMTYCDLCDTTLCNDCSMWCHSCEINVCCDNKLLGCDYCDEKSCIQCDMIVTCKMCNRRLCDNCYNDNLSKYIYDYDDICNKCCYLRYNRARFVQTRWKFKKYYLRRRRAVIFIQCRWRWIICRPYYKICINHLLHDYQKLSI